MSPAPAFAGAWQEGIAVEHRSNDASALLHLGRFFLRGLMIRARMSATIRCTTAGVVAIMLFAPVAFGHHSVAANFDRDRTIEVTGTITAVHLRNPHSQYVLSVAAEDGSTVDWFVEWSDRNALIRRKVDLSLIEVGDVVTVTLWPSRRLENVGFFVQAELADGSIFRDCGFLEFRRAVATSSEYSCEEAGAR